LPSFGTGFPAAEIIIGAGAADVGAAVIVVRSGAGDMRIILYIGFTLLGIGTLHR